MPDKRNEVVISCIGDLKEGLSGQAIVVENDNQYVRACYILSQAPHSPTDLEIWVRSKTHYAWLEQFAKQTGLVAIFTRKTPRTILAEQWNVELPEWLTDNDVLENDLLKPVTRAERKGPFFSRCLSVHLGFDLAGDVLDSDNVSVVIEKLVGFAAQESSTMKQLLERCLAEQRAVWARNSGESWVSDMCDRMADDVGGLWHCLSAWAILNGYPSRLLEYVLAPDQIVFVKKVPPKAVKLLPLEPRAREQALTQIFHFLGDMKLRVNTSTEFMRLVERASGRLHEEFDLLVDILKEGLLDPTKEHIKGLQGKFGSCEKIGFNQLHSLKDLVRPKRPSIPEEATEWEANVWLDWIVEQYTPYRTWQVRNDFYEQDIEEQAVQRFSDWYLREYDSIHSNVDLSLIHCLNGVISSQPKKDLTVILVVDCLPVEYCDVLSSVFEENGLNRYGLTFRFARLPTDTATNKAALLAGAWIQDNIGYEKILSNRANVDWGGRAVIYAGDLKTFSAVDLPLAGAVVVLNLRDADDLLHADLPSKNQRYEVALYDLFSRLAEAVKELVGRWDGAIDDINIYVVTDHGACRILEQEKQSFDSKVSKKLFPNEKYRFATMSKQAATTISKNLWQWGYQFKAPFSENDIVYFIPKGHNTVLSAGAAKGYVHGGASPEEVVVPVFHYKLTAKEWESLFARPIEQHVNPESGRIEFYIRRLVTVRVELQNPNSAGVVIKNVKITAPEVDLKEIKAPNLSANGVGILELSCYFSETALGQGDLKIEIIYEIEGKEQFLPLSYKCEFISAQRGGFSLKDLR